MMDQDLIDLLNNFDRAGVDGFSSRPHDIYIKDGEPTDAFLDALRRDLDKDFDFCSDSGVKSKTKTKKIKTPKPKKKVQTSKDAPNSAQDTAPVPIANDSGSASRLSSAEKTNIDVSLQNSQISATIRSLQLRLNGSLKAIKQLQGELNSAEERADEQKQEIARLHARLKTNAERHHNNRLENDQQQHIAFLMKEIDDLKRQVASMEVKVDEETAEKLRWEERCRNWRSCAELNRQKLQALESASKESKVDKTDKAAKRLLLKQESEMTAVTNRLKQLQLKLDREERRSAESSLVLEKANETIFELRAENQELKNQLEATRRQLREVELKLEVTTRRVQSNNAAQRLQEARFRSRSADRLPSESANRDEEKPIKQPPPLSEKPTVKFEREAKVHPPRIHRDTVSVSVPERDDGKGGSSLHVDTVALIRRIAAKTISDSASK